MSAPSRFLSRPALSRIWRDPQRQSLATMLYEVAAFDVTKRHRPGRYFRTLRYRRGIRGLSGYRSSTERDRKWTASRSTPGRRWSKTGSSSATSLAAGRGGSARGFRERRGLMRHPATGHPLLGLKTPEFEGPPQDGVGGSPPDPIPHRAVGRGRPPDSPTFIEGNSMPDWYDEVTNGAYFASPILGPGLCDLLAATGADPGPP